jgi:hypothetical protein
MLTDKSVDGNKYHPKSIKAADARICQQAAHEAVFMQKLSQYNVEF